MVKRRSILQRPTIVGARGLRGCRWRRAPARIAGPRYLYL